MWDKTGIQIVLLHMYVLRIYAFSALGVLSSHFDLQTNNTAVRNTLQMTELHLKVLNVPNL